MAPAQGARPSTKNGRIPGLFRADQQTERLSASGRLAERKGFEHSVTEALQGSWLRSAFRQGWAGPATRGLVLRALEGGAAGTRVIAITRVLPRTA